MLLDIRLSITIHQIFWGIIYLGIALELLGLFGFMMQRSSDVGILPVFIGAVATVSGVVLLYTQEH
jgi:hypothetical protein